MELRTCFFRDTDAVKKPHRFRGASGLKVKKISAVAVGVIENV